AILKLMKEDICNPDNLERNAAFCENDTEVCTSVKIAKNGQFETITFAEFKKQLLDIVLKMLDSAVKQWQLCSGAVSEYLDEQICYIKKYTECTLIERTFKNNAFQPNE